MDIRSKICPVLVGLFAIGSVSLIANPVTAQEASTPSAITCETPATPAAQAGHGEDHAGHEAETTEAVEFDLLYIDMMIPHHGSIIALAEVALPRLTDQRLIDIANNIIVTQTTEQADLQAFRDQVYPDAAPIDMDERGMTLMHDAFPSMMMISALSLDAMADIMSADWQVQTFCAAENPDLAFIQQTIMHHEMAVFASLDALTSAVHPEIVAFADLVIAEQQAEIDALREIGAELTGGTPVA